MCLQFQDLAKKKLFCFAWQFYKSSDTFYLSSSKLCHDPVCAHRRMCVNTHLCIQHCSGLTAWPTWRQILDINSTCYHITYPEDDLEKRNPNHIFLFSHDNLCIPCSDVYMAPAVDSGPPASSSTSVALWHRKISKNDTLRIINQKTERIWK